MSVAAVRDDFAIRVGRFDNLPQTDGVVAELREQIALDGVLSPILVWTNGEIIDGHTRYRIAEELGMHRGIEFRIIECSEEEAYWKAYRLNTHRRQWTKEQRNAHIIWLRERGWTQQQVADEVGISQRQVSNIDQESCIEVTSKQDERIPGRHVARTPSQSHALNEAIRQGWERGLSGLGIARELHIGSTAVYERTHKYGLRGDITVTAPSETAEAAEAPGRVARLAELAAAGHNSRQIAAELGADHPRAFERVRALARKHDIDIPADRIKGTNRNPVAASEAMTRTVQAVADAMYPLAFIDMDALDPEQAGEWSRSLAESAKQLRTLIRQIKQLAKEQDPHG